MNDSRSTPSVAASSSEARPSHVLLSAIARLGLPLFLFGSAFFLLTIALVLLATPDRFPVHIGDRSVRLSDLESEQKKLLREQVDLESRTGSPLESRAPVLHQVAQLRRRSIPVGSVLLEIDVLRASFISGDIDPISLSKIDVFGSGTTIRLTGEVHAQRGQSVQILASFVDGLRAFALVDSVSEPEYTEQPRADGTGSAPFSFLLSLKHAHP